jgi:hypothetical protein
VERGTALASRLQSFETELLTKPEDLGGLARINHDLIAKAEAIDSPRRLVLDMDNPESPVCGRQEQSAYNGHFESTCYHRLFLFNGEGYCLAAKLRPGSVHRAEGWEELLLPEIDRQQAQDKEVAFRGDAAFAKPELYAALEERGVKYAIRLPTNDNLERKIAEFLTPSGKAQLQAAGPVQELSLSGRQLEDGAACGGEGGVPLRGVVPAGRIHRDQSYSFKPGSGTVLQESAVRPMWIKEDKQAVKMTRLSCRRFRANEARQWLSLIAYNLGNLWRRLALPVPIGTWVADQLAAAAGENRRAVDQARTLLLVAGGGEPSDATALRQAFTAAWKRTNMRAMRRTEWVRCD